MTRAIAAEPRSERTFGPTSRGEGEKVMDSKSEPVPIIVSMFVGESGAGQLAGLAGIGIFFLSAAVIPLYFSPFDEPPPRWNVLTRVLVDMFVPVGFVVFVIGLRHTIVSERPALEWLGTLCLALGLALVVLTFVAHSIQAGSVLAAQERRPHPDWVRRGGGVADLWAEGAPVDGGLPGLGRIGHHPHGCPSRLDRLVGLRRRCRRPHHLLQDRPGLLLQRQRVGYTRCGRPLTGLGPHGRRTARPAELNGGPRARLSAAHRRRDDEHGAMEGSANGTRMQEDRDVAREQ